MDIKNKLARLFIVYSLCTKRNAPKVDEMISYYLGDDISKEIIDVIIKYNKEGRIGENNLKLFLSEIKNSDILKIKGDSYLTSVSLYEWEHQAIDGIDKFSKSLITSDVIMRGIDTFFESNYFKYKFRELRLYQIKTKNNLIK